MNFLQFVLKSPRSSPIRAFEYEELQKIVFSGKILDLGGGEKISYVSLLKGDFKLISINIDSSVKPTVVGDITKQFPFKDNEFDFVISFNTFEHIPEFEKTFSELSRILKKGGKLVFATPFLHQVHGSPNDYWRYTASAIENLLTKNGLKIDRITSMGKGAFLARYSLIYGGIPRFLRPLFASWAWLCDAFLAAISARYRENCTERNYPLGYFVVANK